MAEARGQRNAADPRKVRDAERLEKRREARRLEMFTAVLRTPEGRFVFAELIRDAGIYRSSFNQHGGILNFNEGRRSLGLELLAQLQQLDGDMVDKMEAERRALEKRDAAEVEALHTASAQGAKGAEETDR